MQFAWIGTFFVPEKYFAGNKVLVFMAVFAGFQGAVSRGGSLGEAHRKNEPRAFRLRAWPRRGRRSSQRFTCSHSQTLAHRPALLFSYVFLVDLGLLALTLLESRLDYCPSARRARGIYFSRRMDGQLSHRSAYLYTALAFYFIFALFHSATPLALQRVRKITCPVVESRISRARAPAGVDADLSN